MQKGNHMKLSTKSRYGTRAMMDIAIHSSTGPSMLKDISRRQNISPKYLDHILSTLRKAGLIKNIRGKGGGYVLTRPPAAITMRHIVEALEGSLAPVECVDHPEKCEKICSCATREVWKKMKHAMVDILDATTLENLSEFQNEMQPQPANYSI